MAHKIRVKRVPRINKDGSPSKSKLDYFVSCQSRGKNCLSQRCLTQKEADLLVENHRHRKFVEHITNHPNDKAHESKHSGPTTKTPKQVSSRFLPFHRRGEKHQEEIVKKRNRLRAEEAAREKESA